MDQEVEDILLGHADRRPEPNLNQRIAAALAEARRSAPYTLKDRDTLMEWFLSHFQATVAEMRRAVPHITTAHTEAIVRDAIKAGCVVEVVAYDKNGKAYLSYSCQKDFYGRSEMPIELRWKLQTTKPENSSERDFKRLRQIIIDAGPNGINSSKLTRATQFIGGRRRSEILADLLASEQVTRHEVATGRRPLVVWRAV